MSSGTLSMTDTCEHGEHVPHFVGLGEPSYYPPPFCHGSPDNWFRYSTASKLHRGWCRNDPGFGLLGRFIHDELPYVGPTLLATGDDLWLVPVGKCCQINGQRHTVND